MSFVKPIPRHTPWYIRLPLQIPVIGWMARDILYDTRENGPYALAIVALIWAVCVANFGLVAVAAPFFAIIPLAIGLALWGFVVWVGQAQPRG